MNKIQIIISGFKRNKQETLKCSAFAMCAFLMGSIFIFNISPMAVPDYDMHLDNVIAMSQGDWFSIPVEQTKHLAPVAKPVGKIPNITIPSKFHPQNLKPLNANASQTDILNDFVTGTVHFGGGRDWRNVAATLSNSNKPKNIVLISQYPLINWLPQSVGLSVANLLHFNLGRSFMLMRFANLMFYILIFSFSVYKLLPYGKLFGYLLGLNPFIIFTVSSISGDAFTIGIVSLFIAFMAWLIMKKDIGKKDIVVLMLLGILLFFIKIAYITLLLLIFVIPKNKLTMARKAILFVSIGIFGSLLYLIWSKTFGYTQMLAPDLSKTNMHLLLSDPVRVISSIFATSISWPAQYLTNNGLHKIGLTIYVVFLIVLIQAIYIRIRKKKICGKLLIASLASSYCAILLTFSALYLTWTIVSGTGLIDVGGGFQGRYLLPLSLIAVLPYASEDVAAEEKGKSIPSMKN
jgi:uncharacterized membrane protein